MRNPIFTLLIVLSTTLSSGQTSENPYDFNENKYGYETQKELGLTVLKNFEDYNETDYIKKFLFTKEILSYAMYEYAKKRDVDFEKMKFEEGMEEFYSSMISEHKNRAYSILERIKNQSVDLSATKVDSSSSSQEVKNDMINGRITIYLSDESDNYQFQITGLSKIKGKWFLAEPRLYWHNSADLKLIEQVETQSN